jgi:hypothetical protein
MIRARNANLWAVLGRRAQDSNFCFSSAVIDRGPQTRPLGMLFDSQASHRVPSLMKANF